jgi:amicyanin
MFAAIVFAAPVSAQSLLYRTPDLSGTWVPDPAVVQFNFLHRFYYFPTKQVQNFPMFTLAFGLPANTAIGMRYVTRSEVNASNTVEFYGRWRALGREGSGFSLAFSPAYNSAASSFDGEVTGDWSTGPLTLSGSLRGASHPFGQSAARAGAGAGAVLRVNPYIALSGDVASFFNMSPAEHPAWGAAVSFAIPGSPHTFSVQVSNVGDNTIAGSSRHSQLLSALTSKPLYGFEFTIPLHLARFRPWFHPNEGVAAPANVRLIPSVSGPAAAEVKMNGIHYRSDTVTVNAGETVRWVNTDPLVHTVAFDDGTGTSADIPQNGAFEFKFDRPGTYPYHCTQHPFMKGVVVVR